MDILFDPITRDIVLKGNDFITTDNPSVQNGGILLYARASNLLRPDFQIGIEEVMGSNMGKVTYEMNRWKAMANADGATLVNWSASNSGNDFGLNLNISYE